MSEVRKRKAQETRARLSYFTLKIIVIISLHSTYFSFVWRVQYSTVLLMMTMMMTTTRRENGLCDADWKAQLIEKLRPQGELTKAIVDTAACSNRLKQSRLERIPTPYTVLVVSKLFSDQCQW